MGLHDVRLNGFHQVTLVRKYMFHQASGSFINVDIFLRGENSSYYSIFYNDATAEIYMRQKGSI